MLIIVSTYSCDLEGRIRKVVDNLGNVFEYQYDINEKIKITSFDYEKVNNYVKS